MEYLTSLKELLCEVERRSLDAMGTAANWVAEVIELDGLVWVFGSGHAGVLADETFYRAGGLACVCPIHIPGLTTCDMPITETTIREREDGFARRALDAEPLATGAGDMVFVHSVSGRNAAPVEVALWARERGARVVALTSVAYSEASAPRNALGKRLHEVADLTIDNCAPVGDAVVAVPGMAQRCSPVSTALGAAILHTVFSEACRLLVARGIQPPVFRSANLEGGDEWNQALLERYRGRVSYL